jgi:PAS domain S-box-containing protein
MKPSLVRYPGAIAAVAVAVFFALWLHPLLNAGVVLLVAVAVAAWFCGPGPALLASLLSTLALDYFFTSPVHAFRLDPVHVPRLISFTIIAAAFASVSAGRRNAERSMKQLLSELDTKVQERTADLSRAHAIAVAAETRYRDLVNSIEGIVWEADAATQQFTFVSAQAERVLGYPVSRWMNEPAFWQDHIAPVDRASAVAARTAAATRRLEQDLEYRMIAADGRTIWLRDLVSVVAEGGRPGRLRGIMMDVTDRKRAEEEREELAGRLIRAQEEERSRIGRELHDHVSQTMGVLTVRLDQLRLDPSTPPAVADALRDLRESTADITTDIHQLSHRLHSSTLDYLGLVAAIERLSSEFSARHGIHIDFVHRSMPDSLPSDVALCLFRVTEESLTNIAKHSHAARACIELHGSSDGVRLLVEDFGVGFDVATLDRRAGLGFVSMRERLRVLGGIVHVDSAPAHGTTIQVEVPAVAVGSAAAPRPQPSPDGEAIHI